MRYQDNIGDKDMSRTRTLVLDNGNKVNIECTDPYGFWSIHLEHGQLPQSLRGSYTSFELAKREVDKWLAAKERQQVALQDMAKPRLGD